MTIYTGSNTERQSVGLPGHCDRCAEVGHVEAHPDLGCGDVGCSTGHRESLRYTDAVAHERMADGRCPECGMAPDQHGPGYRENYACALPYKGVIVRLNQYRYDAAEAARFAGLAGAALLWQQGYEAAVDDYGHDPITRTPNPHTQPEGTAT